MDIVQAKADITNWITGFVEKPHPKLSGWAPCPYARRARIDNRIDIRRGDVDPVTDLCRQNMEENDVLIYVYDPAEFSADEFNKLIDELNQDYLIAQGLFALADHPDDVETVNGVVMNQGRWAICFLQDLAKLNEHAQMLADKGYYQDWPETYLQDVFHRRQDPRKRDTLQ